ncbi:MAG: PhoH family protein [Planctomycetes bacterium]|nr:PhoH family protein [Planctomycetota bacterium]
MIGAAERNLKIIRETLGVTLVARDGSLRISGDSKAVGRAAHVLEHLSLAAKRSRSLTRQELIETIASEGHDPRGSAWEASGDADSDDEKTGTTDVSPTHFTPGHRQSGRHAAEGVDVYLRGKQVRAMTAGQKRYLQAIHDHDMTFCIGPAGTGKTYLAVAAATGMLKRGEVRKLVLVRPAVEAGEKLGFLPGDLQEKVNPYIRPLLDALHDMMDYEQIQRFLTCDLIEICPLAFMRGRTLNDALIILDEAQNTTRSQMLMFLTRLGQRSKMIINGDTTQIDLAEPFDSGLIDATQRLARVPGVAFVTLEPTDIVRHNLVQRIVEVYGSEAKKKTAARNADSRL